MENRITINRKYLHNGFGGSDLYIEYYFTTGIDTPYKNTYLVTCSIISLETLNPYLNVIGAELADFQKETNQETLTEQGIKDLFEEEINS